MGAGSARKGEEAIKGESAQEKALVRKSLDYSIKEGAFYSVMVGVAESFFSAFAVFLSATSIQLGIIGSLPSALGSMAQLYSSKFVRWFGSRKRFVLMAVALQGMSLLPLTAAFFLGKLRIYYLIFFLCLYYTFGMLASPVWNSWMGDLVPPKRRGRYFGRRNEIAGFVTVTCMFFAGYFLQQFDASPALQNMGFVIIFFVGTIARVLSMFYLMRQFEPHPEHGIERSYSFREFLHDAEFTNYGHVVVYLFFMNIAVYLSGPFIIAYMMQELHFDFLSLSIINATALLVKFACMPLWGSICDRYGTKRVLALSGFLIPVVPILWALSDSFVYLVVVQVFAGFAWAGFDIAALNILFETTMPDQRTSHIAYYNALMGIAIIIGGILGGVLLRYSTIPGSAYLMVFFLSGIARVMVSFVFVPLLKEVRHVRKVSSSELALSLIKTMPTMGGVHEIMVFSRKVMRKVRHRG